MEYMDANDISYLTVTSKQLKHWLLYCNRFWKLKKLPAGKKDGRDKTKMLKEVPDTKQYQYQGQKARRFGKEISRFYDSQFSKQIYARIQARKLFYKGDTGMDHEHFESFKNHMLAVDPDLTKIMDDFCQQNKLKVFPDVEAGNFSKDLSKDL